MELLRSVTIACPYCAELQDIDVDCSIGEQAYIDDCQVCCQPISVAIIVDDHYEPSVTVNSENE